MTHTWNGAEFWYKESPDRSEADGQKIMLSAALFGTRHRLLIFFELCAKKSPCSDWSTHCYLIGWLFCDVLGIASFAGLFSSAKVGQKSFFERVVLDATYLDQFLSDFVQVKSNFSPRPRNFWPNYLLNFCQVLGSRWNMYDVTSLGSSHVCGMAP